MARFVYRLQKIYELRERRVKEQEQRVIAARREVSRIEAAIEEKRNEIRLLRQNMLTAPHTLMSSHDEYIHKCNQELDQLLLDLEAAKQRLLEEAKRLAQYKAELEALEKHKDRAYEEWLDEERRIETKQLDEIGIQRYFRAKGVQLEEELEELSEEETALLRDEPESEESPQLE